MEKIEQALKHSYVAQDDMMTSNSSLRASQQELAATNVELELALRKSLNDRRGTLDDMEKLVRDNQALEDHLRASNVELSLTAKPKYKNGKTDSVMPSQWRKINRGRRYTRRRH